MKWLDHQRILYTLKHHPIPMDVWKTVLNSSELFDHLSAVERAHLHELATLLLQRKSFNGVQGITLTTEMAVALAAQACLPILKLGLDYYDNWVEVVVYPAHFQVEREQHEPNGLVARASHALSGETWQQGPVILAWEEVEEDLAHPQHGHNVVIHELAHKLDMLNGSANGMPPLHADMKPHQWSEAFSHGYDSLTQDLAHGRPTSISSYAATAPAEFFAVVSELFFTVPTRLQRHYPQIYEQLVLFYRQEPLAR